MLGPMVRNAVVARGAVLVVAIGPGPAEPRTQRCTPRHSSLTASVPRDVADRQSPDRRGGIDETATRLRPKTSTNDTLSMQPCAN
jgi:hypothetical protein